MVKVSKVAVWKIGDQYFPDAQAATKETRRLVIEEMLVQEENMFAGQSPSSWMADNWDSIEARVKAAMAGS
jgi:hypothetical protein